MLVGGFLAQQTGTTFRAGCDAKLTLECRRQRHLHYLNGTIGYRALAAQACHAFPGLSVTARGPRLPCMHGMATHYANR
jgi:hypothetical protein